MQRVSGARTLSETKTFVVTPLTNGLPDNQADCEAAGYYWYDNACHLNPKPPIPWWVLGLVALVIIGGGATVYYASQRKS